MTCRSSEPPAACSQPRRRVAASAKAGSFQIHTTPTSGQTRERRDGRDPCPQLPDRVRIGLRDRNRGVEGPSGRGSCDRSRALQGVRAQPDFIPAQCARGVNSETSCASPGLCRLRKARPISAPPTRGRSRLPAVPAGALRRGHVFEVDADAVPEREAAAHGVDQQVRRLQVRDDPGMARFPALEGGQSLILGCRAGRSRSRAWWTFAAVGEGRRVGTGSLPGLRSPFGPETA